MRYLAALLCIMAMAGCSMLDLPAKFEAENKKGTKTRAAIVQLQDEVVEAEKTLQSHWAANTGESNVDYIPSPPNQGEVQLESVPMPPIEQLTSNQWGKLYYQSSGGGPSTPNYSTAQQVFTQPYAPRAKITKVKVKVGSFGTEGPFTFYIYAWGKDYTLTTPASAIKSVSIPSDDQSGTWYEFDFTEDELWTFKDQFNLYILCWAEGPQSTTSTNYVRMAYNTNDVYSEGQLFVLDRWLSPPAPEDKTGKAVAWDTAETGDLAFSVEFATITGELFKSSGNITTDNFDLGSVPTNPGEWQIQDDKPDGTNITYEAWASDTGSFGGEETYLGTIVDGLAISVLKLYYRVKVFFTSNTNEEYSPTLQSVKADFSTYIDVIAHATPGSLSGLESIGTLSTEISDFKPTTISSMTVTFPFNKRISTWFASRYPKNRIAKVKYGFIAPGFTPADYIDRFFGQIEDWKISSSGKVTVTIYSFHKEWKTQIPRKWETSSDDKEWIEKHPVDVILDILQNFLTVRDSKINYASFYAVRDALPGWEVTRKITENTEEAKAMMEELRGLMTCYFTLHGDGSVGLKRWDANETPVATLTDRDFLPPGPSWAANAKGLINEVFIYFAHGEDGAGNYTTPTAGDEAVNFKDLGTDFDGDSIDNWQEVAPKTLKDKWTRSTEATQVTTRVAVTLDRYKDPRSLLSVSLSGKWIALETGDIVNITTKRYPSTDFTGCTDKPFQIVKMTPNWLKKSGSEISLVLLEV